MVHSLASPGKAGGEKKPSCNSGKPQPVGVDDTMCNRSII